LLHLQRQRSRQFALWLVLAAVLLRALIPAGFMLERSAAGGGVSLAICYASPLARLRADHGVPAGVQLHADCAFAAAAAPALPGAAPAAVFGPVAYALRPQRSLLSNLGAAPRLQPPARGPPLLS
jgi:hypothetical protein